jgi:hypothetical protein
MAKVVMNSAMYDCGGQASDDRLYLQLARLAKDFAHPPRGHYLVRATACGAAKAVRVVTRALSRLPADHVVQMKTHYCRANELHASSSSQYNLLIVATTGLGQSNPDSSTREIK